MWYFQRFFFLSSSFLAGECIVWDSLACNAPLESCINTIIDAKQHCHLAAGFMVSILTYFELFFLRCSFQCVYVVCFVFLFFSDSKCVMWSDQSNYFPIFNSIATFKSTDAADAAAVAVDRKMSVDMWNPRQKTLHFSKPTLMKNEFKENWFWTVANENNN